MLTGFIQDQQSWQVLIDWAIAQSFDDYAAKPESAPYRVENVLRHGAKFECWDGTRMEFAKGFLCGHYWVKPVKPPRKRKEPKEPQPI